MIKVDVGFDPDSLKLSESLMFPILNGIVQTSSGQIVQDKCLELSPKNVQQINYDGDSSEEDVNEDQQNVKNQLCFDASNNESQANVNIEKSTDVVIGPVTRFLGPVTIYHNLHQNSNVNRDNFPLEMPNGSPLVAGESEGRLVDNQIKCSRECSAHKEGKDAAPLSNQSSEIHSPSSQQNCPLVKIFKNRLNLRWLCLAIVTIIVVSITLISTTMLLNKSEEYNHDARTEIPPTYSTEGHNETDGNYRIISRDEWGAKQPFSTEPLNNPVEMVVVAHTAGAPCNSVMECSRRVRDIQMQHFGQNFPDIGYNFLIGGDGNIYVGTGWSLKSQHKKFILLCFMGNFMLEELTKDMEDAALYFLDLGVREAMLHENYRLLAHNQTMATLSPGKNVYKIIKYWDHFSIDK